MVHMGEEMADFALKDQNGETFWLSESRGKKVCLFFHPLAWTKVCADEVRAVEERQDAFAELDAVAVGISVDSRYSKKAWAETLGIEKTRFLSDFWPTGQVARQFGVFREMDGFCDRATVVLDGSHRVIFFRLYGIRDVPDVDEVTVFLKSR
jgi:peroxiredoxin